MAQEEFPLGDLRVVELTQDTLGAMICGRMLAELGADVVMVEPPDGHARRRRDEAFRGMSAETFDVSARSKRSSVLDLATDAGVSAFCALVADADVLLVDLESQLLLERKELFDVFATNTGLIVCCISPYGLTGPLAGLPGSELTVQALTGVLATNGDPHDGPTSSGVPVAAYGGALYAMIALLAALYERQHSGKGQFIDQSESDAVLSFQGTLIPGYLLAGEQFQRVGNRHPMTSPWNNYPTRDEWVVISTVGDIQWRSLVTAMGRPELADDDRFRGPGDRVSNVDQVDAIVKAWTTNLTSAEVLRTLERCNVPASLVFTLPEALSDDHAKDRVARGGDGRSVPRLPFRLERSASWRGGGMPALGMSPARWNPRRFPAGTATPKDGAGPLSGVRVVEVALLTAGPLVGRLLGMLGADVVKVEPPTGERNRRASHQVGGISYIFHINNTDKKSVTLNIGDPADRAMLDGLVQSADIMISNVEAETLAGMRLAPRDLDRLNPALVFGAISGYGRSGPKRGRKTFDMVVQAETGIMALTGAANGQPLKVAMSIVDLLSALGGAVGVIAGLIARQRYNYGQTVDISLFDTGLWVTEYHWPTVFRRGEANMRLGNRARRHAPHGCFEAADGMIALAINGDRKWRAWLAIAGRQDLLDDGKYRHERDRARHVEEVERLVADWARGQPVDRLVEACVRAGIAAARVSTLAEAVEHPQTAARDMVIRRKSRSAGVIRLIGAPIKMSRSAVAVRTAAPELGEHDRRVRDDLRNRAPAELAVAEME